MTPEFLFWAVECMVTIYCNWESRRNCFSFFIVVFRKEKLNLTEELEIMHSVLDTYIQVPMGHPKWRWSSTWINECKTQKSCLVGEDDCESLVSEKWLESWVTEGDKAED